MKRFKGDAVAKLAERLAYTVGSSCDIRNQDQAVAIVGYEFEQFLERMVGITEDPADNSIENYWFGLVQRCVDRINTANTERINASNADVS